jgi:hypothetical protein
MCFVRSPREKEETSASPQAETPPINVAHKKSVHRLSVDRPRRASSSAVVGEQKTKPARTSSSASLKTKE